MSTPILPAILSGLALIAGAATLIKGLSVSDKALTVLGGVIVSIAVLYGFAAVRALLAK